MSIFVRVQAISSQNKQTINIAASRPAALLRVKTQDYLTAVAFSSLSASRLVCSSDGQLIVGGLITILANVPACRSDDQLIPAG